MSILAMEPCKTCSQLLKELRTGSPDIIGLSLRVLRSLSELKRCVEESSSESTAMIRQIHRPHQSDGSEERTKFGKSDTLPLLQAYLTLSDAWASRLCQPALTKVQTLTEDNRRLRQQINEMNTSLKTLKKDISIFSVDASVQFLRAKNGPPPSMSLRTPSERDRLAIGRSESASPPPSAFRLTTPSLAQSVSSASIPRTPRSPRSPAKGELSVVREDHSDTDEGPGPPRGRSRQTRFTRERTGSDALPKLRSDDSAIFRSLSMVDDTSNSVISVDPPMLYPKDSSGVPITPARIKGAGPTTGATSLFFEADRVSLQSWAPSLSSFSHTHSMLSSLSSHSKRTLEKCLSNSGMFSTTLPRTVPTKAKGLTGCYSGMTMPKLGLLERPAHGGVPPVSSEPMPKSIDLGTVPGLLPSLEKGDGPSGRSKLSPVASGPSDGSAADRLTDTKSESISTRGSVKSRHRIESSSSLRVSGKLHTPMVSAGAAIEVRMSSTDAAMPADSDSESDDGGFVIFDEYDAGFLDEAGHTSLSQRASEESTNLPPYVEAELQFLRQRVFELENRLEELQDRLAAKV